MIATFCKRLLFGAGDYLCAGDLQRMTSRSPFSAYLNYLAYDDQLEVYLNQDCSLDLLWECTPLTFAGPKTLTTLEGLFRAGLHGGSVLQLVLHADTHIQPILDSYRISRQVDEALVRTNTERIIGFLDQGRSGLESCGNIPVRKFRLFVAVKLPGDSQEIPSPTDFTEQSRTKPLQDIKRQISETLKAAMLAPRSLPPGELLEWARRLFNQYSRDYPDHNLNSYDEAVPLRK